MRLPLVLILPVLILGMLMDWYIYRSVAKNCRKHARTCKKIVLWSSVFCELALILLIIWPKRTGSENNLTFLMWGLYSWLSVYVSKFIFIIADLISAIPARFSAKNRKPRKLIVPTALAIICFLTMWWGALINRFNIDVVEVPFIDQRVPDDFNGFKIVQISDIHTGTYGDDTSFLEKLVERVNELNPDVILFTGDIVNRRTDELLPFVETLAKLNAPYGVYSVLGNHDYGDYYSWESPEAKQADHEQLLELQQKMGWKLLNNTHEFIHRGNDSIAIIGVENIGDPPFNTYGDLDMAYPADLADDNFKILMSHNPAHWVNDIKDSPDKNIPLTLSGHTHAMQIELFGISPAALRYSTWGGMYDDGENRHRLYVNIGTGEVGIPARIGATPEITLFTLSGSKQ
ncbi:MAG: metallophosphoesterase [Muribaculaceae bacterium]|nr:metallophosphoesterase [Muribaculaceae bacterium]